MNKKCYICGEPAYDCLTDNFVVYPLCKRCFDSITAYAKGIDYPGQIRGLIEARKKGVDAAKECIANISDKYKKGE